jgi:hypothetical protein
MENTTMNEAITEPKEKIPAKRGRPAKGTTASRGDHVTGSRPPERIPLDGSRTRLAIDETKTDPAFHYKWINDVDDKIQRYMQAGYVNVGAEEGLIIGQRSIDASTGELASVVSRDGGKGITVYLLKQPIEFFNEDKAAKEEATERRADALKTSLNSGQNGTYGDVNFDK